jgi:hypothetical protein
MVVLVLKGTYFYIHVRKWYITSFADLHTRTLALLLQGRWWSPKVLAGPSLGSIAMLDEQQPLYRVLRTHEGADYEGQLVNRNRGEVVPGVMPVNARLEEEVRAGRGGNARQAVTRGGKPSQMRCVQLRSNF